METVAEMERRATPGNNVRGAYELLEVIIQDGGARASSTPPNGKSSPARKPSPTNDEQLLLIEIDSSFFEKEIHDSKNDNYLKILTDQFHITQNQINKVRENILRNDKYIVNNKEAIVYEITRGTTYKFDEIEGDVTPESFQKGLIRIGVNKENQKALDFLMLFNLQGYGAASFGLFSSTNTLFNNVLSYSLPEKGANLLKERGTLIGAIDGHQFKQKVCEVNHGNCATTEITENITIKFSSLYDGSQINVGKFKVVAEVDNTTLNYKFKSISLTFWDKKCISFAEKYLKSIGFKRITKMKANDKQLIKTKTSQNNEQIHYDELTCLSDYRLFPYTLSEQDEMRKDPTKMVASGTPSLPEYSGNNLDPAATQDVKVELPQTRLARQATLLLSSKKILEAVQQSIQESSIKKNVGDKELLSEIGKAITILEAIDQDIRALNSTDFDSRISMHYQRLTQTISRIHEFSKRDNAFLVGKSFNTTINEIVLTHLNIVLTVFESSENFITSLQHSAFERFIILITDCKKMIQAFTNNRQIEKSIGDINQIDKTTLDENKIDDVMTALHHDFIHAFEYLKYDSSDAKVPSNSSDFVLFSLQIRCAIAKINQKKSVCSGKIKEIYKNIENMKSNTYSYVTIAELTRQVECYKKISGCFTETIKILQNTLGKINCHFYTQDLEMKGLHPRNIFSGASTPDPLNASLEYMSYLTFQSKKLFDGTKQKYSFFDYILPWRWNSYREKLRQDTYYHLNKTFNDNNKTPRQKLIKMKQIIAKNRPNLLNIFRRSERKKYEELKNHTYQLCLLDAFGRGYLTPAELSNELFKYINKKNPSNASQIKAYAGDLRTKCAEFERTVDKEKMQELTRKLANYKLSSSAKAHSILLKQHQDYVDLSEQVKRELESSSSSGSNSVNTSSLSSSSDSLEKLQIEEEAKVNNLVSVSRDPENSTQKLRVG